MTPEVLVRSGASREAVPFVAEITLLTAAGHVDLWELWDRTERDSPPFWAYPWAGGQALARYILDNPAAVAGRRVLDAASGSGLVAIAAAKAGAASVVATDVDPYAVAAIGINAQANANHGGRPRRSTSPRTTRAARTARTVPTAPRWCSPPTCSTSANSAS